MNNSCKKEILVIRPNGYEFRKKLFSNVDKLLEFFKMDESKKTLIKSKSSTGSRSHGVGQNRHR